MHTLRRSYALGKPHPVTRMCSKRLRLDTLTGWVRLPENFCRGRRNYDAQNITLLRVAVALPTLLKFSYVGKAGRIRRNP